MRQSIALLCVSLWFVVGSFGQSKAPEGVRTAEITKIDAKNKSLQVKEVVEPSTSSRPRQGSGRRGGNGGSGGGGSGRRGGGGGTGRFPGGGVGFPGGGGSGRYPGGGGGSGSTTKQAKEYKVFVTKDTEMKLYGAKIDFTDFRVGDRVTFSGNPHGKSGDVEAMTLTREN